MVKLFNGKYKVEKVYTFQIRNQWRMAMSNMNFKRNNVKSRGKQIANKLEVNPSRKNSRQEEFVSELDFIFNAAPAKENNVPDKRNKTGMNEPVSERTAWN